MTPLADAVVADFDGTLARLPVPWPELRERLGVARIDHLWREGSPGWDAVTDAEVQAARGATPVEPVLRALEAVSAIAILTSNAEAAVDAFLAGQPALRAKVQVVVGRSSLGGPKTDFDTFAAGYARCLAALECDSDAVVYVGDAEYELSFARRLGARPVDVRAVE